MCFSYWNYLIYDIYTGLVLLPFSKYHGYWQFAKDTLSDKDRRATYDKWRQSGLTIPFKEWLAMKDSVKVVSILVVILIDISLYADQAVC